ncbi:MAG: hypothetical protein ACTS27_08045 [Phycisphaerales bacterium]
MKSPRRHPSRISLFVMATAGACTPAAAIGAQIVYTHASSAIGTLDGEALNGGAEVDFVISAVANTEAIQQADADTLYVDHISASISIEGIGEFDFLTPTRTFTSSGVIVGFGHAGVDGLDLLNGPQVAVFNDWALDTDIGPVGGVGGVFQWEVAPVMTTGGVLAFLDGGDFVTFTARVIPAPSGSLALLGCSALLVRRRH